MENKPTPERACKRLTQHLEQINLYAAGIDMDQSTIMLRFLKD